MQAEHEFLTTRETARLLRTTPEVLSKARCIRVPDYPAYIRFGRKILYKKSVVLRHLDEREVDPTKPKTEE
jgi:hypothetical protein